MPHRPIEDPSQGDSLADRSVAYVRSSRLLRVCLVLTVLDHLVAMALVALSWMQASMVGFLALMSVLSWFFAVCLPLMNRSLRAHVGQEQQGYGSELLEMFFRVVLAAQTALYTLLLMQAITAAA